MLYEMHNEGASELEKVETGQDNAETWEGRCHNAREEQDQTRQTYLNSSIRASFAESRTVPSESSRFMTMCGTKPLKGSDASWFI